MARPRLDNPRNEVIHFRLNSTEAAWMDDLVRRGGYRNRTDLLRALLTNEIAKAQQTPDEGDLYDD